MKKTILGVALLLAACGQNSPGITRPPLPPGGNPPALLGAYWHRKVFKDGPVGAPGVDQVEVRGMMYRPRQFTAGLQLDLQENDMALLDPGPYQGLDILVTRKHGTYRKYTTPYFTFLSLNREARVGVIWYGDPAHRPGWLEGWTQGANVKAQMPVPWGDGGVPTFWKNFPAGDHWLGSVEDRAVEVYDVLLAEAGGKASTAPPVPAGLEVPQPNTACPAWVHDQYMVRGFDGRMYPTWHPQIDPVYWCYFGHEHGSDPRQLPALRKRIDDGSIKLAFGYAARKANLDEPHSGYKVFAYDDRQGHAWLVAFHFGPSDRWRLCTRLYEYNLWVLSTQSGKILSEQHFLIDTGAAINPSVDPETNYRPPDCPGNYDLPFDQGFMGQRRIPLISYSGTEGWVPTYVQTLGIVVADPVQEVMAYVIDNPQFRCSPERDAQRRYTCNQMVRSPSDYDWGENRWFTVPGGDVNDGFEINAAIALAQGEFYTDALGKTRRRPTDPDAVRQYLEPGLHLKHVSSERWIPYDPWWVEYKPVPLGMVNFDTHNLEHALSTPN
jgi:hypothetical protein